MGELRQFNKYIKAEDCMGLFYNIEEDYECLNTNNKKTEV